MNLRMWKGILDSETATITFPTTLDEVQKEMRGLEEFGQRYGLVRGIDGEGPAQVLTGRVRVDDLNTEAGIQNLNQLAEVIDHMDSERLKFLGGALALERVDNLNDVLRIITGLDQYEIFPRIKTDEDLGHFLVDTAPITGKFSFPEETQPYLDYAKIGAEQRNVLGGMHTSNGFIKRREQAPVQAEAPKAIVLTLMSLKQSDTLILPASEEQLEQAKRALDVEDFSQAVIAGVDYVVPSLDRLIPRDCISVEDANEMAFCLRQLKAHGEVNKYCAALEVEEPSTFTVALDMAIDIDDYELISGSEREYGRQALRRIGADDELLDTIDGYMDFDQFGRAMMEEDGVRQTGFGQVRRLSKPFPPEPEFEQMMV